jgi:hypothetical protein
MQFDPAKPKRKFSEHTPNSIIDASGEFPTLGRYSQIRYSVYYFDASNLPWRYILNIG